MKYLQFKNENICYYRSSALSALIYTGDQRAGMWLCGRSSWLWQTASWPWPSKATTAQGWRNLGLHHLSCPQMEGGNLPLCSAPAQPHLQGGSSPGILSTRATRRHWSKSSQVPQREQRTKSAFRWGALRAVNLQPWEKRKWRGTSTWREEADFSQPWWDKRQQSQTEAHAVPFEHNYFFFPFLVFLWYREVSLTLEDIVQGCCGHFSEQVVLTDLVWLVGWTTWSFLSSIVQLSCASFLGLSLHLYIWFKQNIIWLLDLLHDVNSGLVRTGCAIGFSLAIKSCTKGILPNS